MAGYIYKGMQIYMDACTLERQLQEPQGPDTTFSGRRPQVGATTIQPRLHHTHPYMSSAKHHASGPCDEKNYYVNLSRKTSTFVVKYIYTNMKITDQRLVLKQVYSTKE